MLKKTLLCVTVLVVFLAPPLTLKDRTRSPLLGPDLRDMEYDEVSFDNRLAGIRIAGVLFLPDSEGSSRQLLFERNGQLAHLGA